MIRARAINIILIIAAYAILAGCSNTKFLAADQLLYTGRDAVFISDSANFKDPRVKQITGSVTAFKPNNSVGGKRILPPFGLWFYNYLKPEEKKTPGWLYRTFAKAPVLISTVNPEVRCRKLESELFGSGYFHSVVWSEIDTSKSNPQKAAINYYIRPGTPFSYNTISLRPSARCG